MSGIENDLLIRQLRWRYAVKRFDPTRTIDARDWKTLEDAMILAPSSMGLQPWKFVVVTDPSVKSALSDLSNRQPQPRDCSHYVVLCMRREIDASYVEKYVASVAAGREVTVESLTDYQRSIQRLADKRRGEHELWNARQVYISLGFLLEAAALLGVDSCPMEGFDADGYGRLLNLHDRGFTAVVACALGYRSADDPYALRPKVRFAASELIEHI